MDMLVALVWYYDELAEQNYPLMVLLLLYFDLFYLYRIGCYITKAPVRSQAL